MPPAPPPALQVAGYCRVSTAEQADLGVSLAAQAEKVRLYCELHGLALVDVVTDPGASAKSLDRPGMRRVLGLLDAGEASGLVVVKLDRLTRNLGDWQSLIDRYFGDRGRCALMSVSESIDTRTASGRMVLNIMMTIAQWERETVVERTRAAVAYKRGRGERLGTVPFGWDVAPDGRTLVPNPAEQAALAQVLSWAAEHRPLRWIAAELSRRGVPTRSGRPWSHSTVQRLLGRHRAAPAA